LGEKGAEGTGRSFKKWLTPLNCINFAVDLKADQYFPPAPKLK
jgi:hypothetical protein